MHLLYFLESLVRSCLEEMLFLVYSEIIIRLQVEPEYKDCVYLPRDGSDIIISASNNIEDKDQ